MRDRTSTLPAPCPADSDMDEALHRVRAGGAR